MIPFIVPVSVAICFKYLFCLVMLVFTLSGCSGSYTGSMDSVESGTQKLLTISPLTKTVGLGGTLNFDASGGSEPYSFEVYYGSGSITSAGATGTYQAPLSEGAAVIRVQDKSGDTGYATVEIADSPVIQPSVKTLAVGNRFPFSVLSGKAPYVFSIVSGEGSINAATGEFVAGSNAGSAVIRVTDADNRTADASVTVSAALSFASNNVYVEKNATSTLSVTGGVAPYSYVMASGAGSVNKTTGVYTAPPALGTSTVHVFDSLGNVDLAVMNITTALSISPSNALIAKNSNLTFSGVGGVPPYSYSILAGGTCIASTVVSGQYAAPSITCSDTVRVTDALGNTSDASVSVTNSLSFSVSHLVLAVGNSYDVSTIVTGGVAPLTYTVPSSQGLFSGPIYTAPNTPGVYTITVYDSQSPANTVTTSVLVNSSLSLLPTSAVMASGSQKNFSASGGVPPYVYSVQSGGGSITDGLYTAPNTSGSSVLLVTDARGNTATASVSVQEALAIIPTTKTLSSGESFTFTASGGTLPYSFSLVSGSGSINSSSGVYTAPGSSGLVTVRVEDASGNRKDALVTILNPLSIAPPTIALIKNGSITFTASGGAGPYTYSVVAGDGSVNATTGVYVAPSAASTNTVRVTDSLGSVKDATVSIYDGLSISPFTKSLAVNQTFTFTAAGGVPPYTYSLTSGVGNVTAGGGYSSTTSGAAVVRVTDSGGNTSDATVSVNSALAINPTSKTLSVNNSFTFSATGGVPPYAFSVLSGNGTVTTAGDYKAPSSSTSAVVRVTDSASTTSDATVTVNDALTISPTAATVAAAGTQSYIAAGGVGLYVYTVVSGGGFFTSSTYTAPSVASGASVAIVVTDSLGNTANATVTVPPITVTIGSPNSSDFITDSNKAAFTVSGTCSESGRTVVVSASDGTNAAVTASPSCSSGTWTTNLNLTSLSDVAITITANHSNANSVAATPASVTVTKDGGVPTITITAPSASSYVGNSITVTGSCSESGRAVNLSATGSITAITTCSSGSYSSTLVYPNSTTDGAITITATHSDSAANAATPATVNVTKDSVAPVISAFTITNSSPTSSTTFNLTSSITDASAITHYCILINSTTLASCTWTSGSLPSSVVINPATSGDKTLSAWVKDAGGNISARRNSNLVTLDLVVPTITISVPAASAYVNASNVSAYTVSGSCNKEGGGVNIKAGSTSVGTATCTSNAWSTSTADFSAIAEGSISLTAVLTDLASNTVTSSAVSITKDIVAPTSPSISINGGVTYANSTTVPLTLAATGASDMYITNTSGCASGGNYEAFSTSKSGWTLSTSNATNTVYVKYKDSADNESTCENDTIVHDGTGPNAPTSPTLGSVPQSDTDTPTLSWSAPSDNGPSGISSYQVQIYNSDGTTVSGCTAWTSLTSGATVACAATSLVNNSQYYFKVRAVDNAGNTGTESDASSNWTVIVNPCPSNYIVVPALAGFAAFDFCVAKYEIKNNSGAKSEAAGLPWTSIARGASPSTAGSAWKACRDIDSTHYDLISNAEWQAIARNIADQAVNWSTNTAYSGLLNRGHSDGVPGNALAASTDNDPYSGTSNTNGDAWNGGTYSAGDEQKRTHQLNNGTTVNGNIIWDFSGNVEEFTKDDEYGITGSSNYSSTYGSGDWKQVRYGNDTYCASPSSTPYCGMGYGTLANGGVSIWRGGYWSGNDGVGIFTANLNQVSSWTGDSARGFRCVYHPNSSGQTFVYMGGVQTFTVPAGRTSITVKMWGAGGGGGGRSSNTTYTGATGGAGAYATATIAVTPGQTIYVYVGGGGIGGAYGSGNGASGGGGGGASEIRLSDNSTRLLIAAGGGGGAGGGDTHGQCDITAGAGGGGGGTTGSDGSNGQNTTTSAGGGATQSIGGSLGSTVNTGYPSSGSAGAAYTGGNGGDHKGSAPTTGGANNGGYNGGGKGGASTGYCGSGGGGGGGYYGGGGGASAPGNGSGVGAGGGGGGSSYDAGTGAGVTSVTFSAGTGTTAPNTSDASYVYSVGDGGIAPTTVTTNGWPGQPGLVQISY